MWEGLSLPHDTKFGNCRCKIVDSRSFHSWSLIHGLRWSGLIKVGPGLFFEGDLRKVNWMSLINSLYPGRYDSSYVISDTTWGLISWVVKKHYPGMNDAKSTLVQVMAWCIKHQAITWTYVDQDLCCHVWSLGHIELTLLRPRQKGFHFADGIFNCILFMKIVLFHGVFLRAQSTMSQHWLVSVLPVWCQAC